MSSGAIIKTKNNYGKLKQKSRMKFTKAFTSSGGGGNGGKNNGVNETKVQPIERTAPPTTVEVGIENGGALKSWE